MDLRVRQCAERAIWLGNDETHYERRWMGKDLQDLKVLTKLTVNWIHSEALAIDPVTMRSAAIAGMG